MQDFNELKITIQKPNYIIITSTSNSMNEFHFLGRIIISAA